MTPELLEYYDRELSFIRHMAGEFASAHPKIAGRLQLAEGISEDPHVERLIEAFALLNARTRMKLDDDFPEITDSILQIVYPHATRPIPSVAIVQFLLDPDQADLVSGCHLPAGSPIETEPLSGSVCRFRTCFPTTLWPVDVVSARLAARPYPAPNTPRSDEAQAVVHLSLSTRSSEVTFKDLDVETLRFHLQGLPQHIAQLYELLFNHCIEVALATDPQDARPVVLPPTAIAPGGFGEDEGLLPSDARWGPGFQLLTEFFAFPQKFSFCDLSGFDRLDTETSGQRLEVFLYLNRTIIELERHVDADTFRLGCATVVNLFRQRAEPISLTGTTYEYRLVPDARRPESTEVFSVDEVNGVSPDGEHFPIRPFYSLRHAGEDTRAFWHAAQRESSQSVDGVDHGTETSLSFVDLDQARAELDGVYVDVMTTCTNRDLAHRIPVGGAQPRMQLVDGEGLVKEIRLLTLPTPTIRGRTGRADVWRLISSLSLDHLGLSGGKEGAATLQEVLRQHDCRDSGESRAVIAGISSVSHRQVVSRVPGDLSGAVCRGIEVELVLDPASYTAGHQFLFATVLERFLGEFCSINSFVRLVLRYEGREGIVRRWPARSGTEVLL